MNHLSANNLISSAQHGFLAKHSTCTNLLEALNDWTKGLDDTYDSLVLYIDFARAFDSVSIPKLLHKIKQLGVQGNLYKCIESFLTNRSQKVRVGQALSDSQLIGSGVPQGSVLGPILFLIFVNDIASYLPQQAKCKLFADDIKTYLTFSNKLDYSLVPLVLDAVSSWSSAWQLPLSVAKCSWMLISNRSCSVQPFVITLEDSELSCVNEVKDLGVWFNSKLTFAEHISHIVTKAKQRIYLLFKAFSNCNTEALILAYKSFVRPLLEYCSPVWSPSHISEIIKLESVQRLFTRKLISCSNLSYNDRLAFCDLLSLEKRRLVADLVLLYKIIHKQVSVDLADSLVLCTGRTRGHSFRFKINRSRIDSRHNFFSLRTIKIWNSLPECAVSLSSPNALRTFLTGYDFSSILVFT